MKFMGHAKRRAWLRARTEFAFKCCLRASTSFVLGFPTVRSAGITREDYLVYPTLSQSARVYQIFDVTWCRIGFGSCPISFILLPLHTQNSVHPSPLRLTVRRSCDGNRTRSSFRRFPGRRVIDTQIRAAVSRKREEMLRR